MDPVSKSITDPLHLKEPSQSLRRIFVATLSCSSGAIFTVAGDELSTLLGVIEMTVSGPVIGQWNAMRRSDWLILFLDNPYFQQWPVKEQPATRLNF